MPQPLAAGLVPPDPQAPKFPRRRCDNCGKLYPQTKPHKRFCKPECKNEFHQHGAAFGPLKQRLEKLINKEVAARVGDVSRVIAATVKPEALARAGFIHRSQLRGLFARVAQLESLAHRHE
jgi:hypothetical protein